ncbi:MAG: hypothetical protein AB7O45_00085 [Alphaproteobacteria bacterium]
MAAVALVVGATLIAMAAPRFLSGLHLADGDPVLRQLDADRGVGLGQIVIAANERAAAVEIHAAPGPLADLAALRLVQSSLADDPRLRRALLDRTIRAADAGLALAPVQPFLWANLAAARLARDGPDAAFDAALGAAIRTAPHEPRLVLRRLDLALDAWDWLTPATRALAADQIRIAARTAADGLALVTRRRFALAIVRDVLADDPALLAEIDRALSRR